MSQHSNTTAIGTRPTTLRHRAEAMLAKGVLAVLKRMQVEHASALGGWLVQTILSRSSRGRRAERQIAAIFPHLAPDRVKQVARASWNVFGRSMAELPHLPTIFADPGRIELADQEVLASVRERTNGTIYVASHMGNWELLPGVAHQQGQTFHGFYRPLSNAILEDRLRQIRQSAAPSGNLLPAASRGVADAVAALRRGEALGILADLYEANGIAGNFLGLPTRTNSLPATLALRCNSQIVVVTITRLPGVRFRLNFEEIATSSSGDKKADIAATTAAINQRLESAIIANPDQWLWSTNRWKGLDLRTTGARENLPTPST